MWRIAPLTHYQTTSFRHFQIERVCRRQFQIWQKWKKVIQKARKHCGKKEKLLITSNFSFPTVFSKGLFPRGVKRCGNGLNQSIIRKHCGKMRNTDNQYFLLFPPFSLLFLRKNIINYHIFNPLPDDKILDWSKFKQITANILKCI